MKSFIPYALHLVMGLSLTGCLPLVGLLLPQHKKKHHSTQQEEFHRRPLETTQNDSVDFYRKKQMVTVYDCNGHVVSHSVQTVKKHLSKTFTIDYPGRKKAWSINILNRRNGSQPVFPSRDEGQFTVDLSPTLNHIRVSEGLNEIEYVFYKCPEVVVNPSGTKTCKSAPTVEKEGIFVLDVHYEVINLPGESEVRPQPSQCPHSRSDVGL